MTEKELKARKFFDEPASSILRVGIDYASFVVHYNPTTQSKMFKKRSDKLMRQVGNAPISKAKVGA